MNRQRRFAPLGLFCCFSLAIPPPAMAEKVPGLHDLVGAKGADGEVQLEKRGYSFMQMRQDEQVNDMFWREERSKRCVRVKVDNGRYTALLYTKDADCHKPSVDTAPKTPGMATVCGVTVENKPYRWKCTVEGVAPGSKGNTLVHYPDQKITLKWRGPNKASVTFEGMKPQTLAIANSEGNTQWTFEGKTYHYTSDPEAAALEVKHFHGD